MNLTLFLSVRIKELENIIATRTMRPEILKCTESTLHFNRMFLLKLSEQHLFNSCKI